MIPTAREAYAALQAGHVEEAEALLDLAATDDPFNTTAVRGAIRMKRRDWVGALECWQRAVDLRPADYTAWFNAGVTFYELGRWEESAAAQRRGLVLNPSHAKAWMKLGATWLVRRGWAEALACQERAVALDPDDAELHIALGTTISLFDDNASAEREYRQALHQNPSAFEAEAALGFVLLRQGKWEEGWQRFEARWRLHPFGAPWQHKAAEPWRGTADDLRGKRVVLYCEQGFGDTIHFCRYERLVRKIAADVCVVAPPSLRRLLASAGMRMAEDVPDHDIAVSLMSLPRVFGTTLDNVPEPGRFGVVPREVARIGVCWHGGARPQEPVAHADDQRRSIPVEAFRPIIDATKGRAISLQEEDLRGWGVADWADTAAIVAGLDLVITVDTAMAHLSASLGIETWLLARAGGCWRWLSRGETTVWYPTMRIFRQPVLDDWVTPIGDVVRALEAWHATHIQG